VARLDRIRRTTSNILFVELIILCLALSFLLINVETTIMLLIFNFLFVSFTYQLNGTYTRKTGLLAVGNVLGLFCNFIFVSLSTLGSANLGQAFSVFYAISYPIVNTLWIVTFWSLSLTALPKPLNLNPETSQ
jgi:hypothetical protein